MLDLACFRVLTTDAWVLEIKFSCCFFIKFSLVLEIKFSCCFLNKI